MGKSINLASFFLLVLICMVSCNENKLLSDNDSLTEKDKNLLKYIMLYENYTDVTYQWHEQVNYNIVVNKYESHDTIAYFITGTPQGEIWTLINRYKYSFSLKNRFAFSNEKLFSIGLVPVETALKKINQKDFNYYKLNKRNTVPTTLWDCNTLEVVETGKQLEKIEFGFNSIKQFKYKMQQSKIEKILSE